VRAAIWQPSSSLPPGWRVRVGVAGGGGVLVGVPVTVALGGIGVAVGVRVGVAGTPTTMLPFVQVVGKLMPLASAADGAEQVSG